MSRKTWWLVGLLVVSSWWLWHRRSGVTVHTHAERALLVNRIWVDRLPAKETDKIYVFALIHPEGLGVFSHASMWEGNFAAFEWKFGGKQDRVQLRFPQDGKTAAMTWEARRCQEKGFDYCLTLRGSPRGPNRWYSMRDWEIKSLEDVKAFQPHLGTQASG